MQNKFSKKSSDEDFVNLSPEEIKKFELFLRQLTQTGFQNLQKMARDHVPVEIFVKELSPLEALVKFLRENLDFTNKKIARLLGRSVKTIWQAYKNAVKKVPAEFEVGVSKYLIPISIFAEREFSVLELLVGHLKETYDLENNQIAKLLGRDNRTVWTVYSRLKQKRGMKNKRS